MIQGTGSHVGKSLMVAGLCRACARRGIRVAPFKPQNMSNNAAIADDGGEIGRAQALQARAAGVGPSIHMNPVLLKPETEAGAQLIVHGRQMATMDAAEYLASKAELLPRVVKSFDRLGRDFELLLVEGAGSPAETNLRVDDIANMGFAEATNIPVLLVGDIERGGVIATLVGTEAVLSRSDAARVKGFVVNKFRGDAGLFYDGLLTIEDRTGWPCFGVVPWFEAAARLPAEDTLGLTGSTNGGTITVAVPRLPRIANFDDLDPLAAEPDVRLDIVEPGQAISADADMVVLPGSKSTATDLAFLRDQGWDIDILAHRRRGGRVLGLCGGYQMLGRTISDPAGSEGKAGTFAGLGLLDVKTVLSPDKTTQAVDAVSLPERHPISAYEIHLGTTEGPDRARPFSQVGGKDEGARSHDGLVAGTYLHGLFSSDRFRHGFLKTLGPVGSTVRYEATIEATLDALAAHLEVSLDVDALLTLAGYRRTTRAAAETTTKKAATAPT